MKPDSRYSQAEIKVDSALEMLRGRSEGILLPENDRVLKGVLEDLANAMEELRAAHAEVDAQREELDEACREGQREHRRYVELFEDAPDGYVVTDIHGVIEQANRAALALFDSGRDFVTGTPLALFVKEEDKTAYFQKLSGMNALEIVRDWELRFRPWRGEPFWASVNIAKVQMSKQEDVGLRWLIRDISNRKQAEDVLRRYGLLAGHSRDIILFMRWEDGRIMEANDAAVKAYGYRHEELLAMTIHELRAPDTRMQTLQQMAEAESRGILFETLHQRRDGSIFPVEVSSRGEPIEGTQTLISVIRDISERRRTESELRENQSRLDLALRSAGMGAWHWDITEDKRYFDDQACHLLGIDPKTFTGATEEFFGIVHPEDCEKVKTALVLAVEHDLPYETEYRTVWTDGSLHHVVSRGKLVCDDKSRPIRLYGIVWDITERKRMEEGLRRSRDALELRVHESDIELLNANQKLERRRDELTHLDRVASMGELASSLAHELAQPLSAIMSNTQAAVRFLAMQTPDLEEIGAALHDIVDDNRRASAVIQNMRSMLKKKDSERSVLDINVVVQETLRLVEADSIKNRVSIKIDLTPGLPRIVGDPSQLQQVLINLILNGFQAMASCEPDCRKLTITTSTDDTGAIRVDVCDTGPGVDEEAMGRLFERFFSTKPEGLGMGLAISQSIVAAHKGRLWADRNPARGMTFCFILPAADPGE
jgi:PAS domain S-box-containing protein